MPSEPEKRMEPLLKAYAEKRRQAAAGTPELHPATRRLLQSEARQLRLARPTGSRRWYQRLAIFWPRLLTAGAIALVLGLGVWYWGSSTPRFSTTPYLAKEDSLARSPAKPVDEVVPTSTAPRNEPVRDAEADRLTLASKPADAKRFDEANVESKLEAESVRQRGALATDQPLPAVPAPTPSIQTKAKESRSGGALPAQGPSVTPLAAVPTQTEPAPSKSSESPASKLLSEARQQAPAGPVVSAPAPTSGGGVSGRPLSFATYSNSTSPRQYYFRNLNSPTQASAMAGAAPGLQRRRPDPAGAGERSSVLVNFAIEQRGPSLRIIDGDGSIYEGRVLTNAAPVFESELGKQVALKREAPARVRNAVSESAAAGASVASADKDASKSEVAFEVFGTNKTLRQSLSLTGTLYVTSTNGWTETNVVRFRQDLGVVTLSDQYSPTAGKLQTNPVLPQVLRVRGLGRVNGSNEVPVDAVPAPR